MADKYKTIADGSKNAKIFKDSHATINISKRDNFSPKM